MKKVIVVIVGLMLLGSAIALGIYYFKSNADSGLIENADYNEEAKLEFAKLSKYYNSQQVIETRFKVMLKDMEGNVLESDNGYLKKDSLNYHSYIAGTEELITTNYAISISHEEKTFASKILQPNESNYIIYNKMQSNVWLDSLHLIPDSLLGIKKVSGNLWRLSISATTGNCYFTEIEYDPGSLELKRIIQYMDEGEDDVISEEKNDDQIPSKFVLVFEYEMVEFEKTFSNSVFDPFQFINITKSGIEPSRTFKDYEVVTEVNQDE